VGGRLDAGTFLLDGAHAMPGACAAAALVCSVGRGGTKRAHAAAVGLPASLGFATLGGGATEAAAEGGMEYGGVGGVPEGCPSPELRRLPRGGEDWAARWRRAGGNFSAGLFRASLDRCRALEPEPKF
jgi:hypothetical protein